jgi:4-methyl-5(b-hydroxyethyl)-thiazole monophosphate biosynthesis
MVRCTAIPLIEGFEEIEAVCVIDILRRAGCEVRTVAMSAVTRAVRGSHGIVLEADLLWDELDPREVEQLVVPGGQPGTDHLLADGRVAALAKQLAAAGRPVGAICAAPLVLAAAGLLAGRAATSHPSVKQKLGSARWTDEPVVASDGVTTSQGVGSAIAFALELVAQRFGRARADELARALVVRA